MLSHDVTPMQVKLIDLKYLPAVDPVTGERNDDGVFGNNSKAAMQAFEQAKSLTVSDRPTHEVVDALGVTLAADFPYQPIALNPPAPKGLAMNLSLFSLLLNLLPILPMLEQDFELEVKNLTSSADGKTKAVQTLHLLEDASKKLRAALGDNAP